MPAATLLKHCLLCCCLLTFGLPLAAEEPPRLAEGQPKDARLQPLRDLNSYFPMTVSKSPSDWSRRAEEVRRRVLVSQGLWPMPARTPLNAVVRDKRQIGEITVEKVYFEAMPGFYVTGSLYRPVNARGKLPAILSPHGHWSNGRFHDAGDDAVRAQIEQDAEQFPLAARSPLQARCVHLARIGCLVFHYDMIGYADSQQISFEVAHRFARQRAAMNSHDNWGLFSPQAESQLQSVMGLQTFSSVRALDFLLTLKDVDPDRLAITGASGGGTQTFMLSAIDPRLAVSMPAVMVSTAMQGGCSCENASCLRIGTGNVELAALFAPRPLGLTAADDWTKEMETKGFPELQQLYQLIGNKQDVMLAANIQFGHNYNLVSRQAMYAWMNKHLDLGYGEIPPEREIVYQTPAEMTVWNEAHPHPPAGNEFEIGLLKSWHEDTQQQLDQAIPGRRASLQAYKELVGGGIDIVVGAQLPPAADVDFEQVYKSDKGDHLRIGGWLQVDSYGGQLPTVFLFPKEWNQHAVLWLSEQGKAGLYDPAGGLLPAVQQLISAGCTVVGVDLFQQGEFLAAGADFQKTRRVANTREVAAYTFGYNHSLAARRIHDVLSLISLLRNHEMTPQSVALVALDGTAPLAIAARAQARGAVDQLAVDTAGFRFSQVDDLHSPQFLPGGARYHDLLGMLAVAAPAATWLAGEGETLPDLLEASYRASGVRDAIQLAGKKAAAADVVRWLLKQQAE